MGLLVGELNTKTYLWMLFFDFELLRLLLGKIVRYQGQYEDRETGLYYNRFRYYSVEEGMYISQDPIKLAGSFQVYGYVYNANILIDPLGLLAYDVPDTPGVYILRNGNDCYVGSAVIGERGMAGRLSDSDHPAAELLNRPGTSVEYREVNLGTATDSSNKIGSESSQRNNILRKYEKAEYEAEKSKKRTFMLNKEKGIQGKKGRAKANKLIPERKSSIGGRKKACKKGK